MTPKEKAIELIHKFYYAKDEDGFYSVNKYIAKQCALILIDEMIDFSMYTIPEVKESIFNYLNEVKQEIEKL